MGSPLPKFRVLQLNGVILLKRPYITDAEPGQITGQVRHRPPGVGAAMIGRILKMLFWLVLLAGCALIAYAYVGPVFFPADFAAPATAVTQTVPLPAGN